MKYKKSVYQSLALITQMSITMLVPIFLCVFAGIFFQRVFHMPKWGNVLFFILGAASGFRNCYIMSKNVYDRKKEETDEKTNQSDSKGTSHRNS